MRVSDPAAPFVTIMFAITIGLAASPARAAPSAETGFAISGQCSACHGGNGISADTSIPNLAGQHYVYLLNQLEAFKNGTRKNPIMHQMVASLTRQQMEDLAAYYASVQIRVGPAAARKRTR